MSLQKTIINLLLKLPDPIIVSMAGGTPVVRDGRTLDARFQFIAHSVTKQGPPPELTKEFARQGTEILTVLFGGPLELGPRVTGHPAATPGHLGATGAGSEGPAPTTGTVMIVAMEATMLTNDGSDNDESADGRSGE